VSGHARPRFNDEQLGDHESHYFVVKGTHLARKRKSSRRPTPWNKGKRVGRKLPLNLQHIRSIRSRLVAAGQVRELALFNLAIDSSLSASDLVQLRVGDIARGRRILAKVSITTSASGRSISFVISPETRNAVGAWIERQDLRAGQYLFPTRLHASPYLSVRQYGRLVETWVSSIGLNPRDYGTQSLRRTKPVLIYRKTQDLAAVQTLLGHSRLRSTARFFDIPWEGMPKHATKR
jgi:integrase